MQADDFCAGKQIKSMTACVNTLTHITSSHVRLVGESDLVTAMGVAYYPVNFITYSLRDSVSSSDKNGNNNVKAAFISGYCC